MSFSKLVILTSFLLFSCSSYPMQAEEIKSENLKCSSTTATPFFKKNGLFIVENSDFIKKLKFFNKSLSKEDFNLIYISKSQNSGGYTLEVEKIVKKKSKHLIYFKENKPPQGSANIMAITATYCFLKINNLDQVEVFIN